MCQLKVIFFKVRTRIHLQIFYEVKKKYYLMGYMHVNTCEHIHQPMLVRLKHLHANRSI